MRMAAIDLVCLGDSIVYGYGTYPMGAWPRLAGEALGNPYPESGRKW